MSSLSWNCRGLGHPLAIPTLCELVRAHRPDFIFLCETLAKRQRVELIRSRLNFEGCFVVDCVGRSGGLCMFWKASSSCKLLSFSSNHIDMQVTDTTGEWRLTGFYGYPERGRRRDSWNLLRRLKDVNTLPWVVMGDFNDLLDPGDKRGSVPHPNWLFNGFREATLDCGITDIALNGYPFTWSRGIGTQNFVEERLDRAMATDNWKSLFPNVIFIPVTVTISDHTPILLKCDGMYVPPPRRRFFFENKWCTEPELPQIIRDCWINLRGIDIIDRLAAVSESLSTWASNQYKHDRLLKWRLNDNIRRLQGRHDSLSIDSLLQAKKALAAILAKEEEHWRQRAKQFWLKDGDQNTKFFHSMASARRKVNTITRLQRDDGSWASTQDEMRNTAKDYFTAIFERSDGVGDFSQVLGKLRHCIDESKNVELTQPFTPKEFTDALNQMHPDKSPGPDGFNPKFYQRFWSIIGSDVVRSCCEWLNAAALPPQLNRTIISLIPKVTNPSNMKDLRPISLCNVVYKLISKVLCNRLKSALPQLIDRAQSAFVEGRLIHDNILIAFEAIHSMKKKIRGKFGTMALKIDISKAYDRVSWEFLEAVLDKLGFCSQWRNWISMCIRSVSYDVLVNGTLVGPIIPGRGLRQGDPLSPYLFILCAEGLSAMINYEMARGSLHGIQISRGGPAVSHLMFADDSIFFCRASAEECLNLKRVLCDYEKASGQGINFQKSGILFSANVSDRDKDELSHIIGVWSPLNTGRYLGLPSLIGRKKKEIFHYLRERLWSRIQGWSGKKLSKAGKEILIKAVAQSIPTYCMAVFSLPTGLTDDMEKLLNKFWWGNKVGAGRGVNWSSWHKLCVDKNSGGMGFRSLQLFNVAMLGKTAWRLLHDPEALVSRVLKAKYFPNGDYLSAKLGSSIPPPLGLEDLRVAELIDASSNEWNVELMEQLLPAEDVAAIRSIPLCPNAGTDLPIWHYSASGCYTVKSAYNIASELVLTPSYKEEGPWPNIWKLVVPLKVKSFLWRAAKDNLPTKAKLLSRSIQVGGECGICKEGFENSWHIFIACSFAEQCWEAAGYSLLLTTIRAHCDSFKEAITTIMTMADRGWRRREEWLSARNNPLSPAMESVNAVQRMPCVGWHDISVGWVRCGVDAAFFAGDNSMGIGIVVRNHVGDFLAGKSMKFPGRRDVVEGELMGVKEALSWLKNLGYLVGFVDCDSKIACDAILKKTELINERGVLADFCCRELSSMPGIRICNVRRTQNAIAHCLAKAARDVGTLRVWNEPPLFVEGHLHVPLKNSSLGKGTYAGRRSKLVAIHPRSSPPQNTHSTQWPILSEDREIDGGGGERRREGRKHGAGEAARGSTAGVEVSGEAEAQGKRATCIGEEVADCSRRRKHYDGGECGIPLDMVDDLWCFVESDEIRLDGDGGGGGNVTGVEVGGEAKKEMM
ncbi:uncharacterized protein LOC131009894 [Salvia miltiorrhiza]|uniref:uncharacterized protein LOC131009894 n=1 Tax=Salvia miltiorrhiza TaxID=226208 RepID=UPI0025AC8E06|nr:uncharacterized protein LOC131009894 [Salvia miltiorrhiza]